MAADTTDVLHIAKNVKSRYLAAVGLMALLALSVAGPAKAACPRNFIEFLARFELDSAFQKEHVQFPLQMKFVDAAANPEPAARTRSISKEEYATGKPLYPTHAVQSERKLLKKITMASHQKTIVHFNKPDSDAYAVDYHFIKAKGCWRLTLVDDHSL